MDWVASLQPFFKHPGAVFAGLFGFFLLLLFVGLSLRRETREEYPYQAREALFTPAERFFFGVLYQAVDQGRFVIFGKVRLADVIKTQTGLPPPERQRAFNKISAKHLDFVICRIEDLSVACAVELDDASHQRAERRARDEFVDAALNAAGITVLHIKVQRRYSLNALRGELDLILASDIQN